MSGLTVGLASIDKLDLELKKAIGTPSEQKSARTIEKVVARHHWMLCTLLLLNAAAMEALPLFLDKVLSPILAVIVSVTAVLTFGEIIPQALTTGKRQFRIAEICCPVVLCCMYMTIFLSWPLGKLLDCILGADHANKRFKNHELRWLLKQHVNEALQKTAAQLEMSMHSGMPANSFMAAGAANSQDFAMGSERQEQGLNRAQMRIFLGAL
jgi:CBS domain containing-hemolysin-like protein